MVIYNGYCRPLKQKVDFEVSEVNPIETSRGVKWQIKGNYEHHKISVFTKESVAKEISEKLEKPNFFEPLQESSEREIRIHEIPLSQDLEDNNIAFDAEEIKIYDSEELAPFPFFSEDAFLAEEDDEETENPTWKTLKTIRDFESALLFFFGDYLHEDNEEQTADTSFPVVIHDWTSNPEYSPITDITYSDEFDIIYLISEVLEEDCEWDEVVNKSITIKQAYDKLKNILRAVAPEEINGLKVKYGEKVYDPPYFESQVRWEDEDGYGLLIYPPQDDDNSGFDFCTQIFESNLRATYEEHGDIPVYMFLVDTDDCDGVDVAWAQWMAGEETDDELEVITSFETTLDAGNGLVFHNLETEVTEWNPENGIPLSQIIGLLDESEKENTEYILSLGGVYRDGKFNEMGLEDEDYFPSFRGQYTEGADGGALWLGIEKQDAIEVLGEPVDYSTLKVVELKGLLADRGLPVSGRKAELIERLEENDEESSDYIFFDDVWGDDKVMTYDMLNEFVDEQIEEGYEDEEVFISTQALDDYGDTRFSDGVLVSPDDYWTDPDEDAASQLVAINEALLYFEDDDYEAEDLEEAVVDIEEDNNSVSISYTKEAEGSPFTTDIGFITFHSHDTQETSQEVGEDDEDVIPLIFDKFIPPEVWGELKDSQQREFINTNDESILMCPKCGMSKAELRANGGDCPTTDPEDESYVAKRACPYSKHFAPMHWINNKNEKMTDATKTAMNNVYFDDNTPISVLAAEEVFHAPNRFTEPVSDNPQSLTVSKSEYYDAIHRLPDTISASESIDGLSMKLGFFESESNLINTIFTDTPMDAEESSDSFSAETTPLPELWAEDLNNFELPSRAKIMMSAEDYESEDDSEVVDKYDYFRNIMHFGDENEVVDIGNSVAIVNKDVLEPDMELKITNCVGCGSEFESGKGLDKKGMCLDCSEDSIELSQLQRYKDGGVGIYTEEKTMDEELDEVMMDEYWDDDSEDSIEDTEYDEGYDISEDEDEWLEEWEAQPIPRDTAYPLNSLTYNEDNYGNTKSTKLKWLVGALGVGSLAAILAPEAINKLFKRK